jgi:hypothetical protein
LNSVFDGLSGSAASATTVGGVIFAGSAFTSCCCVAASWLCRFVSCASSLWNAPVSLLAMSWLTAWVSWAIWSFSWRWSASSGCRRLST